MKYCNLRLLYIKFLKIYKMNKKRRIDDVIESILNLIQEAYYEFENPKKIKESQDAILIEKTNQADTQDIIIDDNLKSNLKKSNSDWSNIKFKKNLPDTDSEKLNVDNLNKQKIHFNINDSVIKEIFLESLVSWQKKHLKSLTENIYQEIVKENLKKKLK